MPYTDSDNVIKRVEPYLVAMAKNKSGKLVWETDNPSKLRYYLYQALSFARKHNHKLYKDIGNKYYLKVKGNKIIAEPKIVANYELIADGNDLLTIISKVLEFPSSSIRFPDCLSLPDSDLTRLSEWCDIHDLQFIFSSTGLVINAKKARETY